mgnify:CR=1 FL=1
MTRLFGRGKGAPRWPKADRPPISPSLPPIISVNMSALPTEEAPAQDAMDSQQLVPTQHVQQDMQAMAQPMPAPSQPPEQNRKRKLFLLFLRCRAHLLIQLKLPPSGAPVLPAIPARRGVARSFPARYHRNSLPLQPSFLTIFPSRAVSSVALEIVALIQILKRRNSSSSSSPSIMLTTRQVIPSPIARRFH